MVRYSGGTATVPPPDVAGGQEVIFPRDEPPRRSIAAVSTPDEDRDAPGGIDPEQFEPTAAEHLAAAEEFDPCATPPAASWSPWTSTTASPASWRRSA
jgi:hypothetical protein